MIPREFSIFFAPPEFGDELIAFPSEVHPTSPCGCQQNRDFVANSPRRDLWFRRSPPLHLEYIRRIATRSRFPERSRKALLFALHRVFGTFFIGCMTPQSLQNA
uniref:Uncharacterized protein n=1 Tax=Steinernema glaseri TaxID=37863 RepID=A0A1I8A8J0_9BILA